MQITIEDISPVEKKVDFELPWADVAPKLDKAYSDLRRDVRLKGFRPGKVPRAIVERMYRAGSGPGETRLRLFHEKARKTSKIFKKNS